MFDRFGSNSGDPLLTPAEIADELRLNPATVRMWISRGRLPATRGGRRKLLVRRSDLERLLSGEAPDTIEAPPDPSAPHPRYAKPASPPRQIKYRSVAGYLEQRPDPEAVRATLEELQLADQAWDAALSASENAPPDPGFQRRLRNIARACGRKHESLNNAASMPGLSWTPASSARGMVLSHELRPGGNRPGPRHLWHAFDRAVDRLGISLEDVDMHSIALAYLDLALITTKIADALEQGAPVASQRKAS